jgi:hypothetical protein
MLATVILIVLYSLIILFAVNFLNKRNFWVFMFLSALVFLSLLLLYNPPRTGMYVAGFTGAGIQMVLILVMQSYFGYAYLVTPLMITLFMGGIVAGSKYGHRIWRGPSVSHLTGLLWMMSLVAAVLVVLLKWLPLSGNPGAGQVVIGCFNFIPGLIVGSLYGMALRLSGQSNLSEAGFFYSADLAGAALGTFIPGIFLIPLIGVSNTFILFCGINAVTGLYILTRWR